MQLIAADKLNEYAPNQIRLRIRSPMVTFGAITTTKMTT
jgi:hypothetical protein